MRHPSLFSGRTRLASKLESSNATAFQLESRRWCKSCSMPGSLIFGSGWTRYEPPASLTVFFKELVDLLLQYLSLISTKLFICLSFLFITARALFEKKLYPYLKCCWMLSSRLAWRYVISPIFLMKSRLRLSQCHFRMPTFKAWYGPNILHMKAMNEIVLSSSNS